MNTKVNRNLNIAIAEAINAGICADVQDRMSYNNSETDNYIYTSTDGYDLMKTIEFIKNTIFTFNKSSVKHSSQK